YFLICLLRREHITFQLRFFLIWKEINAPTNYFPWATALTNFAKKSTLQSGFSARAILTGVYVISLRYEKVQHFLSEVIG
ncbi:hypothetical protein, partial [Gracilibacillus thailandensis]